MKSNRTLIITFTLVLSIATAASPIFAQGLGLGVGSQTRVGIGGGAGIEAGVNGRSDVQTNIPQARTREHAAAGIGAGIESNPRLAARVRSMLPSGATLSSAVDGFNNEGQFLAALHASHNLGIAFDDLKADMTGSHAMSLGSAIQASKPDLNANQTKEEVKKAEAQAKAEASVNAATRTKK